ncbi:MAG: T9SS type A sorting domain-containing protein [Bacteroidota bacterium]
MKKLYTLTFLLILSYTSISQSWQWGKRGGSFQAAGGGIVDNVIDMATDQHNNVYVLSNVWKATVDVDGHTLLSWGGQDVVLSSFTCDGTYRWSKTFGGYGNDNAIALKVDTFGHVYSNIYSYSPQTSSNTAIHIDADSIIPINDPKSMFLVVYDTSGNYKGLYAPQPDTLVNPTTNICYGIDLEVDNSGNVYWLCYLSPGLLGNGIGQVINTAGIYILKYNSSGTVVSIIPVQTTGNSFGGMKMTRESNSGRFYLCGTFDGGGTISMGGNAITHSMYIGAFNSSGQYLWKKENANMSGQLNGRAIIGANSSIYITGNYVSFSTTDTLCLYVLPGFYSTPFVINMDSNGTGIWYKYAIVNGATYSNGITLRTSNEVIIAGAYPGKLKWQGYNDSLHLASNTLYDVFISRFNAQTGALIGMDTLASSFGAEEHPNCIVSDRKGNVYVGGYFQTAIYVANDTLITAGGESDFFIAKYGSANCSTQAVENPPLTTTEIIVYPNPTNDVLHIDNLQKANNYRVINIIGTTVLQGTLQAGSNSIAVQGISAGMYMLELTDVEGVRNVVRVLKE